MWTRSTGLRSAVAGGHESAPIRWAWVSGDPAGLKSSRRSGAAALSQAAIRRAIWVRGGRPGIESEAGRRALSQRRSGGVISRERRTWESGNPGTKQPAGGLERATAGGGYLPRSAGMRARGQRTRGDPAELPRRLAVGYGGITSGDFLAAGQTNRNKTKDFQKRKTKRGEWVPLMVRSGLLSRCTHEGGTGTRRRGYKLK